MSDLRDITETKFTTIVVKQSLIKGVPIGFGECKAVRLRVNLRVRNVTNTLAITQILLYYGDEKSQERELLRNNDSPLIITDRLEKVFVRNANSGDMFLQVQIIN